ncbi:MAG: hypothetical protein GWP08_13000 [Nitrospiraceae bacterium]|nr:hypothetical protein [Nitrospiraceae bacterium]
MVGVLPALVLGALFFSEQEIPGLAVDVDRWTGRPTENFRHADLDGDSFVDLVLPRHVFFQDKGVFSEEKSAPVPETASADVWENRLYLRRPDGLRVVDWDGQAWRDVLVQDLDWPRALRQTAPRQRASAEPAIRFTRFLHDLDADGVPEIVAPGEDGIHVYAMRDGRYDETSCLRVYPPLQLTPPAQTLWPPDAREIVAPAREESCEYVLEGTSLWVITSAPAFPDFRVRYRLTHYVLNPENGFAPQPESTRQYLSEPLPQYMRPLRLRPGDMMDFGGGDWNYSRTSALPMPIHVTSASTDGGKTVQTVRSVCMNPCSLFVDYDGDGDLDMVTESSSLFDGGIRETVSRFLTSNVVDHELRIHLQTPGGQFSKRPDITGRFTIRLDAPPIRSKGLFWDYRFGNLFSVSGDFDGDGKRDVVVHDRPKRLAVYLSEGNGFAAKPVATVAVSPQARFGVTDIDGDGRSDIAVHWSAEPPDGGALQNRVFLTREEMP